MARRDGDVLALGTYAGRLGALVRAAKFGGAGRLFDELGLALGAGLARAAKEDAALRGAWLVPVPSHRRRRARRGPDPSERLARAVARASGRHRLAPALRRARHGPAQSTLQRNERLSNVRGAFVVDDGWVTLLSGRRLILVDDVLTTGATARAAAEPLRTAGAEVVLVLVIAGPGGS